MTFEQHFERMIEQIYHDKLDKHSIQYQDMRRSFYSGAALLMTNPGLIPEVVLQLINFSRKNSFAEDTRKPQ